MLLGITFANLLKGIITMTRIEAGEKPVLPKECLFKHSLADFASRTECAALSLSVEDISLLDELSPYIEWAGRYPLPKKAEDVICVAHGSREYQGELELWERLTEALANEAWAMKGGPAQLGGKRLYVKKSEKPDADQISSADR
jgi:hypothetical protein